MYKVIVDHNPSHSDNDVVKEGLIKSYEAQFGERDKEFSIFLKNDSGKIFGGIQGMFDSEAIYIEALWVEENLRKQGYGKKLLATAEREAIENGCRFSLVDTWDFQAEEFYLKNGYEKIGELKNYWHGHSKLFLRKTLSSSEFHFLPAESSQISLIQGWLQQDHIKEWIHGTGLQNTLNGLEKFFRGESGTTYWIGYHKNAPLRSRPSHCIWNIKAHEFALAPSEGKIDPLVRVIGENKPGQCIWAFINGIDNTKVEALEAAERISNMAKGEQVLSMPNDTTWWPINFLLCIILKTSADTSIITWTVKFLRYLLALAKQRVVGYL